MIVMSRHYPLNSSLKMWATLMGLSETKSFIS